MGYKNQRFSTVNGKDYYNFEYVMDIANGDTDFSGESHLENTLEPYFWYTQ